MKTVLVLLAILMALLLAMPIAASPSVIDPAMVLDTIAGGGAVISADTIAVTARESTMKEAVLDIVAITSAALIAASILIYLSPKPSEKSSQRKRLLHYARDQPAAA